MMKMVELLILDDKACANSMRNRKNNIASLESSNQNELTCFTTSHFQKES